MPKQRELKFKSPAEFFSENKNIAGFDNPGKSLYTTVRELVENGLDACESIRELPDISVRIEELSTGEYNSMMDIGNVDRVDESLYADFESEKDKAKREQKEARASAKAAAAAAKKSNGGKGGAAKAPRKARSSEQLFYKVTVNDNGSGMPHEQIPMMLGRGEPPAAAAAGAAAAVPAAAAAGTAAAARAC